MQVIWILKTRAGKRYFTSYKSAYDCLFSEWYRGDCSVHYSSRGEKVYVKNGEYAVIKNAELED